MSVGSPLGDIKMRWNITQRPSKQVDRLLQACRMNCSGANDDNDYRDDNFLVSFATMAAATKVKTKHKEKSEAKKKK